MNAFTTPRPVDTSKQLNKLVTTKNDRRNALQALRESAVLEAEQMDTKQQMKAMDAMDSAKKAGEGKLKELMDKTSKAKMNRSLGTMENRLYESGRKELFNQVIFEMVYNACWIDDAVKEATTPAMYEAFNETVDILRENGIEVDMESNVSKYIQNVHEVVNEVCKKAAGRITGEAMSCKDNIDSKEEMERIFNFDLNDDESTELDNKLADLGKEDIEKLVKDKVLSVVQDEKQKGQAKNDEIESIKNELNPSENDVVADDEVTTNMGESPEDKEGDQPINPNEDMTDDDAVTTKESFQVMVDRNRRLREHRMTGTSLFECLMMANVNSLRNAVATTESFSQSPRNEQVMNVALQESVLVYTVMETLNTLGLCKFDNSNVKELSKYYKSTLK